MSSAGDKPLVVIVGLGPAGPDFVTQGARHAFEQAPVRFVRTARHLGAQEFCVAGAQSLDHHYEHEATFPKVYRAIVEEVVAAALVHGHVAYGVPGSPFVLEDTVELLRNDDRVRTSVVAGMSFLDLAWDRLGIDPMHSHVRLVDGERFVPDAAGDHGPMLVAQVYSKEVASRIKLAVDDGPSAPVVALLHLGHDDESMIELAWDDIDRDLDLDHLSCLYIPELQESVGEALVDVADIVHTLRHECPWDQEQTHQSLGRHLIEETYEALEAIDNLGDAPGPDQAAHFEEELGDVLCQVLFHATIAAEEGLFSLSDVARTLKEKLVHRHPHVFGDVTDLHTASDVVSRWEQIKQKEKGRESLMDGIPSSLPALTYVTKIERKASGVGLGDETTGLDPKALWEGLEAHLDEDAVGVLLFALARKATAHGVDPEAALRVAARKMQDRFTAAERAALREGTAFADLDVASRLAYWEASEGS